MAGTGEFGQHASPVLAEPVEGLLAVVRGGHGTEEVGVEVRADGLVGGGVLLDVGGRCSRWGVFG